MAGNEQAVRKSTPSRSELAVGHYVDDIGIRADHVHDDRTVAMMVDEDWQTSAGSTDASGWAQRAYVCPECQDRVVFGLEVQKGP